MAEQPQGKQAPPATPSEELAALPGSADLSDIDVGAIRRRRFNPAVVVLGMLVVALGVGLLVWGLKSEAEKMTVEQRMEEMKNIFILPAKDQVPRWRRWAASSEDVDLKCEALTQLAFLKDPEGIKLAIKGLGERSHAVRGTAAQVLAHYGSPAADEAKPALLKAVQEADDSDRRQLVWSLVELKEAEIFKTAMDLYRSGELTTVERLEGGRAFDPMKIAALVSIDQFAQLSGDQSTAVRQLVATILADNAAPKWTDKLIELVKDKEMVVAMEAASGLGKIADEKARQPLLDALRNADKEARTKFLQALRDGIGGEGLVLALDTVAKEPEATTWFQTRQLMEMLELLADPRAGDALVAWVERAKPHPHWKVEAGLRLAEVGDMRGAKYVAERYPVESKDIYTKEKFWQADRGGHMLKNDRHRIVGSRMLADLAKMYSKDEAKKKELAELAAEPVLEWMTSRPQPHANGLRFLAWLDHEPVLPRMREWAFPDEPLPVEGAQPPFPTAFETAQSALRYLGRMRDSESYDELVEQFGRKESKDMDITLEGLMGAGLAMLGMSLRAVALGAAEGLSEWGPHESKNKQTVETLLEFIEDKTWNEQARWAGCYALAWIGSEDDMKTVAKKIDEYAQSDEKKDQTIAACLSQAVGQRHMPELVPELVKLMRPEMELNVRNAIGHSVGVSGLSKAGPEVEQQLFEMLKNPELRNGAALALVLGGKPDTAARAVAMYADFGKEALNEFKDLYYLAFGYWSYKDLDVGNIYRYVENAEAISRVKINGVPQEWASQRLIAQFDNLQYDNGPHSETRVVLRYRLRQVALTGESDQKKAAIRTLKFMKEQGTLMALREAEGETGQLARKAFHALMNPKMVEPEDLSKFKEEENK
jgi:HEAT repeat protein